MISIVVPVYNVEKYLRECVDSLLGQTYSDIEVVLVDDGSTDGSPAICDEYAASDKRVKAIHQANGGHTAARKAGALAAAGDWICFVDSDDTIDLDTLESALPLMMDNVDIVAMEGTSDGVCTPEEYGTRLLQWRNVHLVGKFFRRAVIADEEVFDIPRDVTVAEDLVANIRTLRNLKGSVALSALHKYHYRPVEGSMSRSTKVTAEYDLKIMNEVTRALEGCSLDLHYGFATFRISILKHLICDKYSFDQEWAMNLKQECKGLSFDLIQKTVLLSVNHHGFFPIVRMMVFLFKIKRRIGTKVYVTFSKASKDRINY